MTFAQRLQILTSEVRGVFRNAELASTFVPARGDFVRDVEVLKLDLDRFAAQAGELLAELDRLCDEAEET